MNEDDILTVTSLAAYLRVHRSTVYRMLRLRQVPAFKIGSDWRFLRSSIDQWIAQQSNNGTKVSTRT